MKKYVGLFALWAGVIAGFVAVAHAAQTCQRTDFFCYESGPTGNLSTPARLDSSGNLSLAGNMVGSGNSTVVTSSVTGQSTISGPLAYNPASITVTSSTILTPTAGFNRLVSTGGPEIIIGFSTTSIPDGEFVIIGATVDTNAVTITSGTSSGTGVGLGAATRVIDSKGKLGLIYDAFGNIWREVFYSAN